MFSAFPVPPKMSSRNPGVRVPDVEDHCTSGPNVQAPDSTQDSEQNLIGKTKLLGENLSRRHFYHKPPFG
jgi:hypothetical protein